jgi:elongation factor P
MATIDPVKLRPGMKIVIDKALFIVTEFQHRTPGNLRSFVVCKLRSYPEGRIVEKTFRGAADWPEPADFEQRTCQFLYQDQDGYVFMDTQNFEQFTLEESMIGFGAKLLIAEAEVIMAYWNNVPIGVEFPPKMDFLVTETIEFVAKGNTSGNIMKDATIETGLVVQVPAFVKRGDRVRLNTADGSYVERA